MAGHSKQKLPLQLSKQQQLKTVRLLQLLEQSQQWEQEVTTTKFELVLRDQNLTGKIGMNTTKAWVCSFGSSCNCSCGGLGRLQNGHGSSRRHWAHSKF